MIYVFVGENRDARKNALKKVLTRFDDRVIVDFNDESFDQETYLNFLSDSDLFGVLRVVIIRGVLESDFGKMVLVKVPEMSKSKNVFIIVESEIKKEAEKTLKKYTEAFEEFSKPKSQEEKFNIFSITDAFGARDKKNTWVLMQKAGRKNIAPEEILNILLWQVKNLLFVRDASLPETGLNPFVYRKSATYAKNFQEEELKNISRGLVRLFHESHLGLELAPNLELFILKSL